MGNPSASRTPGVWRVSWFDGETNHPCIVLADTRAQARWALVRSIREYVKVEIPELLRAIKVCRARDLDDKVSGGKPITKRRCYAYY